MPSIQSKMLNGFLKMFNVKALINKTAKTGNRKTGAFFSKAERKKYLILTTHIDHKEVSVMGKDLITPEHVIYFHGGMYTLKANSGHKRWLIHLFTFLPESKEVLEKTNKILNVTKRGMFK